jgi:hypothetical protein
MEPARTIIRKLGGDTKVAALASVHRVTVAKWKRPRASGGTGGTIPLAHIPNLLMAAKAVGVPLTAEDFIPSNGGAPE